MTKEEKKSIVDEVLKVVHAESQEVSQLNKSDNADEFLSLPVITTNGELKTLKMGTFKDALQKADGSDRENIIMGRFTKVPAAPIMPHFIPSVVT